MSKLVLFEVNRRLVYPLWMFGNVVEFLGGAISASAVALRDRLDVLAERVGR